MITGDPICIHGIYLAWCGPCRRAAELNLPPHMLTQCCALADHIGHLHTLEDDMKKHIEPGFNVIAEHQAHQAHQEWEERTKTVADLRKTFLALPTELKREVLQDICFYCFRESREPCNCENDE